MERRPAARALSFLAYSEDRLNLLIETHTRGKEVLKIKKRHQPLDQFVRWKAEVLVREG